MSRSGAKSQLSAFSHTVLLAGEEMTSAEMCIWRAGIKSTRKKDKEGKGHIPFLICFPCT
ncbi:Uncharacterized protein dnm_041610 [Desulfonema magnum]|uniref:Uncharacterized protein n=1 Tax=Desulfonema magnum TaxID=45655 RepID=A0A975GNM2_9BACT|nr:Uncharacterized protein dnm_041610 [Desulfonema magnum]